MLTQKYDDPLSKGEQPPSADKPQNAIPVSQQTGPARITAREGGRVLLLILVIAFSLVAGSMPVWPWETADEGYHLFSSVSLISIVGAIVVVAGGGTFLVRAFLFRSWRAFILVPVTWMVGYAMTLVLVLLVTGGWTAVQDALPNWVVGVLIISFALMPLLACSGVGMVCALVFNEWRRGRQKRG